MMSSLTVAATRSIEIDAPRAKVFGVVEEPGHLERFHPFCERNEVTAWNKRRSPGQCPLL
jgi:uncharacterized protein YndB with AHSA1/START domain